jgi:hypothetical protein
MFGAPWFGPWFGEEVGVANSLAAVRAEPELGEDDGVALHDFSGSRVGDERLAEAPVELGQVAIAQEPVEKGEEPRLAPAARDAARDLGRGKRGVVCEPVLDDPSLGREATQGCLARSGVAVDRKRALKAGDCSSELGDDGRRGQARVARELKAADLLQRELPARTSVFEGADFELEGRLLRHDRSDGDRRAAGIEKSAAVADHEMSELDADEVISGKVPYPPVGMEHVLARRAALPHDCPRDSVGAGKRSGS